MMMLPCTQSYYPQSFAWPFKKLCSEPCCVGKASPVRLQCPDEQRDEASGDRCLEWWLIPCARRDAVPYREAQRCEEQCCCGRGQSAQPSRTLILELWSRLSFRLHMNCDPPQTSARLDHRQAEQCVLVVPQPRSCRCTPVDSSLRTVCSAASCCALSTSRTAARAATASLMAAALSTGCAWSSAGAPLAASTTPSLRRMRLLRNAASRRLCPTANTCRTRQRCFCERGNYWSN